MFISLFYMSARIIFSQRITNKKTCGFFLASARIELLPISEIACFFRPPPPINFLLNRSFFYYFVALINFLEICQMFFFISSPSLPFSKIDSMFFFLNVFFTALPH